MRPRQRREGGEHDPFRSRLEQIIDLRHPLARLARTINWRFPEGQFGAVYTDGVGRPPLPTRMMACGSRKLPLAGGLGAVAGDAATLSGLDRDAPPRSGFFLPRGPDVSPP